MKLLRNKELFQLNQSSSVNDVECSDVQTDLKHNSLIQCIEEQKIKEAVTFKRYSSLIGKCKGNLKLFTEKRIVKVHNMS